MQANCGIIFDDPLGGVSINFKMRREKRLSFFISHSLMQASLQREWEIKNAPSGILKLIAGKQRLISNISPKSAGKLMEDLWLIEMFWNDLDNWVSN